MRKNYKISGQVSLGVMVAGSLVGAALFGAVFFRTYGDLSVGDLKNRLLAQFSTQPLLDIFSGAPLYQCPDKSFAVVGSGSWTNCNGQIQTGSTCDTYNQWWYNPPLDTVACELIQPALPPPVSFKVLSPNGGENWTAGTLEPITWSSVNYPPYAGVDLRLFKKRSGIFNAFLNNLTLGLYDEYDYVMNIGNNVPNSHSFGNSNWGIPNDLSAGEYKVQVVCALNYGYGYGYGKNCTGDESDAPFTITAAAATAGTLQINVYKPLQETVMAGTNQAEVGRYGFSLSGGDQDFKLLSLPLSYSVYSGSATDLTTCKLYDYKGTESPVSGSNVVNPSTAGSALAFKFDGGSLLLKKDTLTILVLRCNVKATATGTYSWGYKASSNDSALDVSGPTDNRPKVVALESDGSKVTAISGGALSVALDTQASYILATPGTTVTFADLKFFATGEDVNLKQISLVMSDPAFNTPDNLVDQEVTLWDGATQVGTATFSSGDHAIGTITGFTVSKDSSKVLRVKGRIAGISVSEAMNRSGEFPKVDYDGGGGLTATYGVGQSSGLTINPTGSATKSTGVRIMKAYPLLEKVSLSNAERVLVADGSNPTLHKFKVTAQGGDISIGKFSFKVSSSNVTVSNYRLYAFTDSSFSSPDGDFGGANNAGGRLNQCYQVTNGAVEIYPDKTGCSELPTTIKIPNGGTRYFQLTANVSDVSSASILSIQLEGDAGYPVNGMQSASGVNGDANNDFIWSPRSTTTNTGTAVLNDNDWTNGYGVTGLPSTNMTAQTLTAEGATCTPSKSCDPQYCQYGGDLQKCVTTNTDCSTSSVTIGGCLSATANTCDAIAQAVLNSVGGCTNLNSSQYPSVYKACCSFSTAPAVTIETLLSLLDGSLQDGVIIDQEKADLLKALNDYLF